MGFVTCKDDSHIIASVARGDKIITGTTHSDEAIWILRQVHTKVAPLNIMLALGPVAWWGWSWWARVPIGRAAWPLLALF